MKMRSFTFTPDLSGRADFRLAYETFRGRDPQKCVKEERAFLAVMQRQLERVSEPIGELAIEAEFDLRMRKLLPDGGAITVSQKIHEKFEAWLEETQFQAGLSVQVEDFRDRWGQAEKADDTAPAPETHV